MFEGVEDWLAIKATFDDCHNATDIAVNIGEMIKGAAVEHEAQIELSRRCRRSPH